MPSIEEVEQIWDIPSIPQGTPETPELKKHCQRKEELLIWCLDHFLVPVAGPDFWGPDIRYNNTLVAKGHLKNDNSGVQKVYVSTTSEAFGQLVFKNCRDKWICDFKFMEENPNAKIPRYHKDKSETHQFKNRWSTSKTGQVQGGGWHKDAFLHLNERINALSSLRKDQRENHDNDLFEFGRQLIRKANNIGVDGAQPATKKRKTPAAPQTPAPDVVELVFLDE